MSAGPFRLVKYQTAYGWVVKALVQPGTLELQVAGNVNFQSPLALYTGLPSAIMRGGRRKNGIHARQFRLVLNEGQSPPPGYSGRVAYVPILTPTIYFAAQLRGPAVYLGRDWTISQKIPEVVN